MGGFQASENPIAGLGSPLIVSQEQGLAKNEEAERYTQPVSLQTIKSATYTSLDEVVKWRISPVEVINEIYLEDEREKLLVGISSIGDVAQPNLDINKTTQVAYDKVVPLSELPRCLEELNDLKVYDRFILRTFCNVELQEDNAEELANIPLITIKPSVVFSRTGNIEVRGYDTKKVSSTFFNLQELLVVRKQKDKSHYEEEYMVQ